MFCWKCGAQIADGSTYCSECGADQRQQPFEQVCDAFAVLGRERHGLAQPKLEEIGRAHV